MFHTRAQSLFCVGMLTLVLLCVGASTQATGLAPSLARGDLAASVVATSLVERAPERKAGGRLR